MERSWKLGDDLSANDNLLAEITFGEMVLTAHCNCRQLTPESVREEYKKLLNAKLNDAYELFERNIDEIIAEAKIGRGGYEDAA